MILDIGHGAGSFAFRTAEAALAGPMFDLSTCLSKFLALGLELNEVVSMATEAPARLLRYEDHGSLRNVATIVSGRELPRRTPTPRAVWAEKWDRGGTNSRMRQFQCELVAKGHTPEQMCGCG